MRKTISIALAAMTFAGGVMASTAADARDHRYYRNYDGGYRGAPLYYRDRRDNNDAAIVAGVAGLVIGAALASGSRDGRYYNNGYYGNSYYNSGYYNNGYYGGYYAPPQAYYARPYYRHYSSRCRTITRYGYYGEPYMRETRCR